MQIEHTLTIHASVESVWPLLQRPQVVVESLPGVTLTSLDGEDFTGEMSVGLGPMRLRYGGEGVLRYDTTARAIHIEAEGSEQRGAGSAAAVVDVAVSPGAEDSTRLDVTMSIDLQGKPAQFGRGILSEVVVRLATQFGKNLERQVLAAPVDGEATAQAAAGAGSPAGAPTTSPALSRVPALPAGAPGVGRQVLAAAAGAVAGAVLAGVLSGLRRDHVSVVVVGTDDPAWVELARELVRARR